MMMKDILGVQLPSSVTADQTEVKSIGVTILKTGQLLVNGNPSGWTELEELAKNTADKSTQIIIAADLDARHGAVVKVMDLLRKWDLTEFAFQVERQQSVDDEK